ncbi:MAG TPA: MOSC N-terminal beta barrel domain-containing protein [Solirubrobacteraceae bacterium]|nr:MOSC N-terminal beta barrel domain-containing protein [Solirubrobacteraceae bacterium]
MSDAITASDAVTGSDAVTVTALAVTPVKALRLQSVSEIELGPHGPRDNRRFCVIDERGRMLNGKVLGELQTVAADYDGVRGELTLRFADGSRVSAVVAYGDPLSIRFFSHQCGARLLSGPWAQALSAQLGRAVRLVEAEQAADRGVRGSVSFISRASLSRLAAEAGEPAVDARRFRMLIEVDGVAAHAEDSWVGRRVKVGADAVVVCHGHVGRCLTTSRDPETGQPTLPTLDLLRAYRGNLDATEPLPFGIYGEVAVPGTVRVGDTVTVSDG